MNDAAIHIPFATALFSLDRHWIANRKGLINNFQGERYLAVADDFDFNDAPQACYLCRNRNGRGLSDDPAWIYMGGGNSGYGAFNLAYLKQPRRIILLGYDFCHSSTHWHSGYAWQGSPNDPMYRKWALHFLEALPQIRKNGIEVLNASRDSTVTAFPKVNIDDIL